MFKKSLKKIYNSIIFKKLSRKKDLLFKFHLSKAYLIEFKNALNICNLYLNAVNDTLLICFINVLKISFSNVFLYISESFMMRKLT